MPTPPSIVAPSRMCLCSRSWAKRHLSRACPPARIRLQAHLRACLERLGLGSDRILVSESGECVDHTPDKRELDECLGGFGKQVIFTIESTIKGEPGKAAFHNPALLDHHEFAVSPKGLDLGWRQFLTFWEPIPSGIGIRTLDNLNAVTDVGFDPAFPFPPLATIGEQMHLQVRWRSVQHRQELLAPCAIRDVGGKHLHAEQQAQSVNNQVMFASVDFLAAVVA